MSQADWYPGIKSAEDVVGCAVEVWWAADKQFFPAKVTSWDPKAAKHSVCYSDGDKEELCLLTQFWKLKVAAPSVLITSGLAEAGEMLYLKQMRPSRGRPAKGPSAKKLEGCRHLLSEDHPVHASPPAPAAQHASAPIAQSHSLNIKLEKMTGAEAAPAGGLLRAAPTAPPPAAAPMIIDMTSDAPDSKQLAAPTAEPLPAKPAAGASSGKRSRQQAAAPVAQGSTPGAAQAGGDAHNQQGPAKRARPVREATRKPHEYVHDSPADDEGSEQEGNGDSTSSSEYDAADALFKMANSKPSKGRKGREDARRSGASSKLQVTPGLVLAGDRAAAAAAGVMPGYITEQLVKREPVAAATASPVPISFVQSPATAGKALGSKAMAAGSPAGPTSAGDTAAIASSWFMTCPEEEFREYIKAQGWMCDISTRNYPGQRPKVDTTFRPPASCAAGQTFSKKSFRSLKSVRVFLAQQEIMSRPAAAESAKDATTAPQQALMPLSAPVDHITTMPAVPADAAEDAAKPDAAPIVQQAAPAVEHNNSDAISAPALVQAAPSASAPARAAAPPAAPAAAALLQGPVPNPQLITAALPSAAVTSGQLLAAGDDWQVHKLFMTSSSAEAAQAQQQGLHNSNHFMVLVRLPDGAISSSVDVKCGQRAIVVNYKKATTMSSSMMTSDNRYIILPEAISPEGVQASVCAATGSLVVRAAIVEV